MKAQIKFCHDMSDSWYSVLTPFGHHWTYEHYKNAVKEISENGWEYEWVGDQFYNPEKDKIITPTINISVSEIAKQHHEWVVSMGWGSNTTILEKLMLVVSECGEAANECRGEKPTDKFGSELADIILRTLSLAENEGLDIEKEIMLKMESNKLKGNKGRIK